MNTTTTTAPLAALALAHGFAPDRNEHAARSSRVIHVDFGRLSLGVSVKPKKRRKVFHERAEGFWGYFSEQVVYGLLAMAALSSSLAFVVLR
jgi:hypothetical protein